MWAFTASIYTYFIPLILIADFITKGNTKKIYLKLMAASNAVLIFYACWLIGFYKEIVLWLLELPKQNTKQLWEREVDIEALIINVLRVLLPFLFMVKKYAFNKQLTVLMWVLLNYYSIIYFGNWLIGKETYSSFNEFYIPYALLSKMAFYCSGLIFFYSLFEILNKNPFRNGTKG